MILHSLVMEFGVFVASLAQILLKKSAEKNYGNLFQEYINIKVICAYSMMLLSTLCTVYAFQIIPISFAMLLDATGYIFVTFYGYCFFKEQLSLKRIFALCLIISGIYCYAIMG